MEQKIINILSEIKEDETLKNSLSSDSKIIDKVGLDSLQMINFILMVEEAFNIEIDYEEFDFDYLESINSFCNFLKAYN
ncbi:acyl carrier protein [Clostridium gasigenes]|uniref:Acyl carrier protein n=1 Tax=Clostridium gasigenes TaxID=94869 RepID=A0A7X0SDG3_9CLOT|nr:acyl carrier protein [Clostridium gasigenes]MBB6715557.1 acyl carrier protein [Clostridium gasigenes]MBU3103940.1 acyl carrier protein [Clostridium gasigenes]MBU3134415.1 acyl carrier protein [Clostridium gasigenes]